jgi:hypothetical protein
MGITSGTRVSVTGGARVSWGTYLASRNSAWILVTTGVYKRRVYSSTKHQFKLCLYESNLILVIDIHSPLLKFYVPEVTARGFAAEAAGIFFAFKLVAYGILFSNLRMCRSFVGLYVPTHVFREGTVGI